MAKSKNHTSHNQNRKDHRNGIHKAPKWRRGSMKGVCPKVKKNTKFARKGNKTRQELRELAIARANKK